MRSLVGAGLRGRLAVEDVVQETFARALRSLPRFRWEGEAAFERWLATIAEHVVLEEARAREKDAALELPPDVPGSAASPSKALRREERMGRLEEALAALSPEHREVILLARIERLSTAEIARRMGRSRDAVKQLLSRALKKLKEAFGGTESFHLPDRPLRTGGPPDAEAPR
ncbi:MAG: sigma-70 family RNA polymerase sigma factor [Planctomycetes bacterium]|nr:sigma-70 family RNA polymerase sigma factor [Planctomycetota bacterium]